MPVDVYGVIDEKYIWKVISYCDASIIGVFDTFFSNKKTRTKYVAIKYSASLR